jgi:hypothetical protein
MQGPPFHQITPASRRPGRIRALPDLEIEPPRLTMEKSRFDDLMLMRLSRNSKWKFLAAFVIFEDDLT